MSYASVGYRIDATARVFQLSMERYRHFKVVGEKFPWVVSNAL